MSPHTESNIKLRKRLTDQSQDENLNKNEKEKLNEEVKTYKCFIARFIKAKYLIILLFFLFQFGVLFYLFQEKESPIPSACLITNLDTIRALNRTKTAQCHKEIKEIGCLSERNKLYPNISIKNNCVGQFDAQKAGNYLGCFKDYAQQRILGGSVLKLEDSNSPKKCIKECTNQGFMLAGVQYGVECFCGDKLSTELHKSELCQKECPGDSSMICGGYYAMNIYSTGVVPFNPINGNEMKKTEGSPVRIVFLLTVSGRAVRQVFRLIKKLYNKRNYYYIHVDSRNDFMYQSLIKLKLPNIRFAQKRFATIWGGASLLKMLTSCMEELLKQKDWEWDYILNLSESDYPIKPLNELTQYLTGYKGQNFVKSHGQSGIRFIQKQGLLKTFYECENRMWKVADRSLPKGIQIDGGSDWICLHKTFVEYVIAEAETDSTLSTLYKYYNYTLLPAESFFHTVLRNSRFCQTYINNNLHYTNWNRKLGCKCQHKKVVDWCGCSPNDLTLNDKEKLLSTKSRMIFFTRKVESVVSQGVLDFIDRALIGVTEVEPDERYWESLYHEAQGIPKEVMELSKLFIPEDYRLREVYSYHFQDSLQGIILSLVKGIGTFKEILLKVHSSSVTLKDNIFLKIGAKYDKKELIFRDFYQTFSLSSSLTLQAYYPNLEFNVQVFAMWFNPVGDFVFTNKMLMNESFKDLEAITLFETSSSQSLNGKLWPGIWRIIFSTDEHDFTDAKGLSFLVTGEQKVQSSKIQSSPEWTFKDPIHVALESIFGPKYSIASNPWQNSVNGFYEVISTCEGVSACTKTHWSSFSPDDKSQI